jgi:hypothetical protein
MSDLEPTPPPHTPVWERGVRVWGGGVGSRSLMLMWVLTVIYILDIYNKECILMTKGGEYSRNYVDLFIYL